LRTADKAAPRTEWSILDEYPQAGDPVGRRDVVTLIPASRLLSNFVVPGVSDGHAKFLPPSQLMAKSFAMTNIVPSGRKSGTVGCG
jgi:hypothetical protein